MSNEVQKIKSLISESTWDKLQYFDCIIAGGAITSIYTNKEINDFDVYFKDAETFTSFIHEVFGYKEQDLDHLLNLDVDYASGFLNCVSVTKKSILFLDGNGVKIQAIICGFYPTPQDIFDKFDFTINMGALDCKTEKITLHDDFLKHNSQRYIQFNPNTLHPLISLLRVKKYTERGYTISKSQFLRIALQCRNLKIETWEDLRNEIGGMYGLDMTEVFKDDCEFSIDKAIEILDTISDSVLEKFTPMTISFDLVKEQVGHLFKYKEDEREELSDNRYFKNVGYDQNSDIYYSIYKPSFKYTIGGYANGGVNGIYVYKGVDVLKGMYNNYGYILEIVSAGLGLNEVKKIESDKYSVYGDVLVKQVYTKDEFKRKFKKKEVKE